MPLDDLSKIKRFPDEVYGTETTEGDRPSSSEKKKIAPLHATLQNVKNSGLVLLCDECEMWRQVYAKRKLTKVEVKLTKLPKKQFGYCIAMPFPVCQLINKLGRLDTVPFCSSGTTNFLTSSLESR